MPTPLAALPAQPPRSRLIKAGADGGSNNRAAGAATTSALCTLRSVGMDLDAVRTFVAVADTGQFQERRRRPGGHPAGRLQAHRRAGEGPRRAAVHPDRARRPADHRRAGVPAARPRAAAGRRAGRRLGAARPPRAARRRARPSARARRATARLPPRASRHQARRGDAVRRGGGRRRGPAPARSTPPSGPSTRPARRLPEGVKAVRVLDESIQLLTGPAHALAAAPRSRRPQLAGHRIWMPGIVRGTEWAAYYDELSRRVRPDHRGDRPELRHRAAARHDRRHPGAGHLRRRADPALVARRLRPAADARRATRCRSTRTR